MPSARKKIHEVDFCALVAAWVNEIVRQKPADYPFHTARLEGMGSGDAAQKRKDLRFVGDGDRLVLCGEVKLPGTPEGRSALNHKLMTDAAAKADEAGVQYFFTWNVNEFALWDRSLWDRPWFERRVRIWQLGRTLPDAAAVNREENLQFIRTHFLPGLLAELAEILSGRRRDWAMPPDDFFIRSLESHLDWPVALTSAYVLDRAEKDKAFDRRVQTWMSEQGWLPIRADHEQWARLVDNMAKTLAYVWANRLIFYKALRARFTELPALELKESVRKGDAALAALRDLFRQAVRRSGDYEPLLMPEAGDWGTELVFHAPHALDAWRGLLRSFAPVDFREVPSDVVGRIFQKLIGPEERHRYGQHFTGDDVVDLINSFCIRTPDAAVLDPACGSGSFLVRAYYRKRQMDRGRPHQALIGELFGCDISQYPAHLATLNLAAREINEEANYPRVARRNFFDFTPDQPFHEVRDESGAARPFLLPPLDAVVGNPPYVRQEKVEKSDKERFGRICGDAWPDFRLTGRSDLHCYFWPAAARFLKPDGYFGFLASSSRMDVEYGFALQGWILRHFRLLAVMESAAEPWFEDARVKTCVAVLQRCDDEAERMATRVRFVRFTAKLADVIGVPPGKDEDARQAAVNALRDRILNAKADFQDENLRVVVKAQKDLWADGVRAGRVLAGAAAAGAAAAGEGDGPDDEPGEEGGGSTVLPFALGAFGDDAQDYRAGKWGRYVRAPDLYFDVMRRFGSRFVPLGEIARIRFGVKTGCDAFFMPKDVTGEMLDKFPKDREFQEQCGGAPRKDAATGKLRIIEAGDGSVHPVETAYVAPELHSPMEINRPIVRAAGLKRVVLLVREPMEALKRKAPWVWRYLRYGMTAAFASSKSKPVPVPERSSCASRDPWYDLTGLVRPGAAFWPMAQQYRHIVPGNPESLICNHRLFDVSAYRLSASEQDALVAILNSTLVGLFKTFYGRYTGMEGSLDTEVIDVNLLDVPDPRGVPAALAARLSDALGRMSRREVGRLVEEPLMECHSPERARKLAALPLVYSQELRQADRRDLDDAVFELLSVSDGAERQRLIDRLYEATARHFRDVRVVEIEKMQQRAKSGGRRFGTHDLAADIWDAAGLTGLKPPGEWVSERPASETAVSIPLDRPAALQVNPLFGGAAVTFGKGKRTRLDFPAAAPARLVARLAQLGVSGDVKAPSSEEDCTRVLERLEARMDAARGRFRELAESRTGDEAVRGELLKVLERWFVVGREARPAVSRRPSEQD